jgi:hypothetical protein
MQDEHEHEIYNLDKACIARTLISCIASSRPMGAFLPVRDINFEIVEAIFDNLKLGKV